MAGSLDHFLTEVWALSDLIKDEMNPLLGINQVACNNRHQQQHAPKCKGKTAVPHIKFFNNSKKKLVFSVFLLFILFSMGKEVAAFSQKKHNFSLKLFKIYFYMSETAKQVNRDFSKCSGLF